jgi:hypothetical protein
MAAVADVVTTEAPPAAGQAAAPAPVLPYRQRDLEAQARSGVKLDALPPAEGGGVTLSVWLPALDDSAPGAAAEAGRTLHAAVAAAREAALAGPEYQEHARRVQALRAAEGQLSYYVDVRRQELRAEVKAALAAGRPPEQAEASLERAEAEGKKFTARVAQLRPLCEESRQRAEAALSHAVRKAYNTFFAAAGADYRRASLALLEALNPLALKVRQAKAALEAVHRMQTVQEDEAKLPDEKGG